MKVSKRLIILFLLPASALYFFFFLLPTIRALVYSLYDWRGFGTNQSFVGLSNYIELFGDRLFWRSMTHWMGGMGVLILMLAILPSVKANTLYIMKAEFGWGYHCQDTKIFVGIG